MDGGRILKSTKKSYAEHLGTEGLSDVVRQMMKEQAQGDVHRLARRPVRPSG